METMYIIALISMILSFLIFLAFPVTGFLVANNGKWRKIAFIAILVYFVQLFFLHDPIENSIAYFLRGIPGIDFIIGIIFFGMIFFTVFFILGEYFFFLISKRKTIKQYNDK